MCTSSTNHHRLKVSVRGVRPDDATILLLPYLGKILWRVIVTQNVYSFLRASLIAFTHLSVMDFTFIGIVVRAPPS